MTIKEIRALTGLSQVKFAEKYGIPRRSVENWELDKDKPSHRECPEYVINLLENAVVSGMVPEDFKAITILYRLMYKEVNLEMVFNDMEHDYLSECIARNGREVLWYMDESNSVAIYKDTLEELTEEEIEEELE